MANRNVFTNFVPLRTDVDAADNPQLAAATFDSLPSFYKKVSGDATSLKLLAYGKGNANDTMVINLWGGHGQEPQQPAMFLGSFTFTLGTMQCNHRPEPPERTALTSYFYFDEVAETAAGGAADLRIANDSATNRIGIGIVRLTGESWIGAEVKTVGGAISKINVVGVWVNETIPET